MYGTRTWEWDCLNSTHLYIGNSLDVFLWDIVVWGGRGVKVGVSQHQIVRGCGDILWMEGGFWLYHRPQASPSASPRLPSGGWGEGNGMSI